MPVYDFKCYTCLNTRTITLSLEQATNNQTCGCGKPMTRIYTSPPIHFKGNGWATKDK